MSSHPLTGSSLPDMMWQISPAFSDIPFPPITQKEKGYTMYQQDLALQTVTETQVQEEHPIIALFPVEVEEKEYTWPEDWSWSDDMLIF